jgi:hypothetical protein
MMKLLLLLALQAQDPQAPDTPKKEPQEKSFWDLLTDDQDGAFDVSEMLLSQAGFLPVPVIVTEPAVGLGGGLFAAFFHEPPFCGEDGQPRKPMVPPSVSVAGGMATSNGTWACAAGHFQSWNGDDIRYMGAGGYASVNLDFYGLPDGPEFEDNALEYNIRAAFLVQEVQKRIWGSLRAGLRYLYLDAKVDFDGDPVFPAMGLSNASADCETAGLGGLLAWDSRDNVMSPTEGFRIELRPQFYDEALGGDFQYGRLDVAATGHLKVDPFILSLRIDGGFTSGDVPFFHLPFIQLRGVPAARYFGEHVVVVEGQVDFNVYRRWFLVAFGGAGRATTESSELDTASNVYAGGGGFRYLLARSFGLQVGVDVGVSSDGDFGFYLIIGSAWF